MRLKQHRLIRRLALTATVAVLAMAVALAFGAGVSFAKTETTEAKYYEDSENNLCVGLPTAGLFTDGCQWAGMTGSENIGIGFGVLRFDSTGFNNVAIGSGALRENTGGRNNVASGDQALRENTEGNDNIANGVGALQFNTEGSENTASGSRALFSNTEGTENTALGFSAGFLTTGSRNVDIANKGVPGESGTTRIGAEGTQTQAFVAGIQGTAVTGCTVQVTTAGQLGCNQAVVAPPPPGAGNAAIATFASQGGVQSGHCLNYLGEGQGNGPCPPATSGYPMGGMAEHELAGPTPANGATVTNLAAVTNATVTGTDTATVTVTDNTTGTTLLACTVTSTTKNYCENTTESGKAGSRDSIEVRVTANNTKGSSTSNNKSWRVTFRY